MDIREMVEKFYDSPWSKLSKFLLTQGETVNDDQTRKQDVEYFSIFTEKLEKEDEKLYGVQIKEVMSSVESCSSCSMLIKPVALESHILQRHKCALFPSDANLEENIIEATCTTKKKPIKIKLNKSSYENDESSVSPKPSTAIYDYANLIGSETNQSYPVIRIPLMVASPPHESIGEDSKPPTPGPQDLYEDFAVPTTTEIDMCTSLSSFTSRRHMLESSALTAPSGGLLSSSTLGGKGTKSRPVSLLEAQLMAEPKIPHNKRHSKYSLLFPTATTDSGDTQSFSSVFSTMTTASSSHSTALSPESTTSPVSTRMTRRKSQTAETRISLPISIVPDSLKLAVTRKRKRNFESLEINSDTSVSSPPPAVTAKSVSTPSSISAMSSPGSEPTLSPKPTRSSSRLPASSSKKSLIYDPDKHCGVIDERTGVNCTRFLTCKTHSIVSKRAVTGRNKTYDSLMNENKVNVKRILGKGAKTTTKDVNEVAKIQIVEQYSSSSSEKIQDTKDKKSDEPKDPPIILRISAIDSKRYKSEAQFGPKIIVSAPVADQPPNKSEDTKLKITEMWSTMQTVEEEPSDVVQSESINNDKFFYDKAEFDLGEEIITHTVVGASAFIMTYEEEPRIDKSTFLLKNRMSELLIGNKCCKRNINDCNSSDYYSNMIKFLKETNKGGGGCKQSKIQKKKKIKKDIEKLRRCLREIVRIKIQERRKSDTIINNELLLQNNNSVAGKIKSENFGSEIFEMPTAALLLNSRKRKIEEFDSYELLKHKKLLDSSADHQNLNNFIINNNNLENVQNSVAAGDGLNEFLNIDLENFNNSENKNPFDFLNDNNNTFSTTPNDLNILEMMSAAAATDSGNTDNNNLQNNDDLFNVLSNITEGGNLTNPYSIFLETPPPPPMNDQETGRTENHPLLEDFKNANSNSNNLGHFENYCPIENETNFKPDNIFENYNVESLVENNDSSTSSSSTAQLFGDKNRQILNDYCVGSNENVFFTNNKPSGNLNDLFANVVDLTTTPSTSSNPYTTNFNLENNLTVLNNQVSSGGENNIVNLDSQIFNSYFVDVTNFQSNNNNSNNINEVFQQQQLADLLDFEKSSQDVQTVTNNIPTRSTNSSQLDSFNILPLDVTGISGGNNEIGAESTGNSALLGPTFGSQTEKDNPVVDPLRWY